jgi:hypothetical protein
MQTCNAKDLGKFIHEGTVLPEYEVLTVVDPDPNPFGQQIKKKSKRPSERKNIDVVLYWRARCPLWSLEG